MHHYRKFAVGLLVSLSTWVSADQVITGDLIVHNSLCVGVDCVDGETFGFDTVRLKSATPQILFEDTSSSAGSFPNQHWLVGIGDGGTATPTSFFIRNVTTNLNALVISPDGDLALGAGAEMVPGAISVGDLGSERRVSFVADASDDNDAVNLRQFQDFQTSALQSVDTEVSDLDDRLSGLESRLSELMDRLEVVAAKVE